MVETEFVDDQPAAAITDPRATRSFVFFLADLLEGNTHAATELEQLEHCAMRHISELRRIYAFYSALGQTSEDNTFTLSRIQVCRAEDPRNSRCPTVLTRSPLLFRPDPHSPSHTTTHPQLHRLFNDCKFMRKDGTPLPLHAADAIIGM